MAGVAAGAKRVVVMVQQNHTTDNYFAGLAAWGANVATGWPRITNPPPSPPYSAYYPPHDRRAYFDWLTTGKADRTQFETAVDLRYYLYLAIRVRFSRTIARVSARTRRRTTSCWSAARARR